jgi:hypothetical protein
MLSSTQRNKPSTSASKVLSRLFAWSAKLLSATGGLRTRQLGRLGGRLVAKIRLSRVLFKDEDKMMLEVALKEDYSFTVEEGDSFLSIVFVKAVPDEVTGRVKIVDWDPIAEESQDGQGD